MLMAQIDTLIFDLDNTLIDRNAAMRLALEELIHTSRHAERDLETILDDIMDYDNWGYTDREEFCSWLLNKYHLNEQKVSLQTFFKGLQRRSVLRIQPNAEVQAGLQTLSMRYKLVLATNGGSDIQRAKIRQAALESYFQPEAIFISGEMGCEKPDPEFFKKIIRELQSVPERTMVIGDSLVHDIGAAAYCGLFTCWLSHYREGIATIRPGMVINNIREISTWSKP